MEAVLFYIFSGIAVVAALMMVLNPNPVGAAISLIVVMISLAVLFVALNAHFVGILQIMVYAGAIMVLFMFVIMLLNLRQGISPDWVARKFNTPLTLAGIVIALFTLLRLFKLFSGSDAGALAERTITEGFGTTKVVGTLLYTDYILPFEAASVLLLAAIVGAVVLAKSRIGIEEEGEESLK